MEEILSSHFKDPRYLSVRKTNFTMATEVKHEKAREVIEAHLAAVTRDYVVQPRLGIIFKLKKNKI